jgi:hypothetical protein
MPNALKRFFQAIGPERAAVETEAMAVLELEGDGAKHPVTTRVKVIEYPEEPKMLVLVAEIGQFLIERLPAAARPHILQEVAYHGVVWRIVAISAVFADNSRDLVSQRLTGEPVRPSEK